MNIQTFIKYKSVLENKKLNMKKIFNYDKNIKYYRRRNRYIKKNNNLLKNNNLQQNKNRIENKINLILNKLTVINIDKIVIEFIQNVFINDKSKYDIFIKTLYVKILNEIQFIENYINFFDIISNLYNKLYSFKSDYLIHIIEDKINNDYLNLKLKEDWLKDFKNENFRKNNLLLISYLINKKYLNQNLNSLIESIIITQNNFLVDIFNWFKFSNNKISKNIKNKILKIIENNNISFRDKTLLLNLINNTNNHNKNNNNSNLVNNTTKKTNFLESNNKIISNENRFIIESENIYEEYNYLELIDEVKSYIKENCEQANFKNLFCKIGIEIFLKSNNNKILILFEKLIKQRYLYKSNLSRGLLYFIKNKKNNYDKTNLVIFLSFMKNKGITRNIEFLLKKYKI